MVTEVTLQELLEKEEQLTKNAKESRELSAKLVKACSCISKMANSGDKIKIITDYDADGICSAYIMQHIIEGLNSDADLEVICNDRRGSYGVPKDLKKEDGCKYIICDMGSNEIDYILDTFGNDTVVFDHHLIENDDDLYLFKTASSLLNPKALEKDGKYADYCATGLAFRAYRCLEHIPNLNFVHDEKTDNTIMAIACIGTIGDMVDLMDENSYNRKIVKEGLNVINNATNDNFDYVVGNFLSQCGLQEGIDIYAADISFKVVPVINAGGRTSDDIKQNGAQLVYNAISQKDALAASWNINDCISFNQMRKERVKEMQEAPEYEEAILASKDNDNGLLLYCLKENTPTAYAGLIAGKLADETGKAVLAVTYNSDKGCYVGSGRNSSNNKTSLKEFVDMLATNIDGFEYGGHNEAIGISKLTKEAYIELENAIKEHGNEMERVENRTVLKISPSDILSNDTLEKLKRLEPTGNGWKIPPIEFKGREVYRNKLFIAKNPKWKKVKIDIDGNKNYALITDWNYTQENYPRFSDSNTIKVLADIAVNSYSSSNGVVEEIKLTARHDEAFQQEYLKEIEIDSVNKAEKEHTL